MENIKIISGHSNDTNDTFVIPENIEVWFLEQEGDVCYIEPTTNGLKQSMREIQNTKYKHKSGETIKNYQINFDLSQNTERGDVHGVLTYSDSNDNFINDDPNNEVNLKYICESFSEISNPYKKTIIYCFFCRGIVDPFHEATADIYYNNHDIDMDFSGFDGGKPKKRKTRTRKTKKRKTKKRKTRRRKMKR
jgi:hypothetical protein